MLHLRRNDTARAPWKLQIAPLNILPQSALGSKMTSFQLCPPTAVAARDHARRLSAPQPNQFLFPSRGFSLLAVFQTPALLSSVLRQRFPSRRTNEARSWSPPRLPLISSPLSLQIEERAIQELLLHYRAHDNPDELIVVERASKGPIAAPTWNKH